MVLTIHGVAHGTTESIEVDFWAELAHIEAESIGWIPLGERAYLHHGNPQDSTVVQMVGLPDAAMAAMNVVLLG